MRGGLKTLRLQQLDRGLGPLRAAGNLPRPQRGWLRAARRGGRSRDAPPGRKARRAMSLVPSGDGSTPLSPDEEDDLIPSLATKEELNEWERLNILEPRAWDLRRGYLDALRAADQADIRPLLAFARS